MNERDLRRHLVAQLNGGLASLPIEEAIRGFPPELAGRKLEQTRHTPWEILEHMRAARRDILRFTIDPDHVMLPWPDEHWPKADVPNDRGE